MAPRPLAISFFDRVHAHPLFRRHGRKAEERVRVHRSKKEMARGRGAMASLGEDDLRGVR